MSCMFHDNAGSIRVAEKIGMRYETDIEYQGMPRALYAWTADRPGSTLPSTDSARRTILDLPGVVEHVPRRTAQEASWCPQHPAPRTALGEFAGLREVEPREHRFPFTLASAPGVVVVHLCCPTGPRR